MKNKVITLENKAAGEIELSEEVFAAPLRKDILARMVNYQLAKRLIFAPSDLAYIWLCSHTGLAANASLLAARLYSFVNCCECFRDSACFNSCTETIIIPS